MESRWGAAATRWVCGRGDREEKGVNVRWWLLPAAVAARSSGAVASPGIAGGGHVALHLLPWWADLVSQNSDLRVRWRCRRLRVAARRTAVGKLCSPLLSSTVLAVRRWWGSWWGRQGFCLDLRGLAMLWRPRSVRRVSGGWLGSTMVVGPRRPGAALRDHGGAAGHPGLLLQLLVRHPACCCRADYFCVPRWGAL